MNREFQRSDNEKAVCLVCPHRCIIGDGKTGICGVRKNNGGRIELTTYGIISGYALDPVEKKPLYHFFPGKKVLSVGSYGCNMRCDFCQNYHISQEVPKGKSDRTSPEALAARAVEIKDNIGVAYTYNEPVIWLEYVRDTGRLVKKAGLNNVMVTNGYATEEALDEFLDYTDAFNVDLKSFNGEFYKKLTGAELEPVKRSLKKIAMSGKHLEITTLVIPGQNDKPDEMEEQVRWIAGELGREIPFHLSRYFPMYRRSDPVTPHETLARFHEIASEYLDFVYMGNTMSATGQDTKCPSCGSVATKRSGYYIQNTLSGDGSCLACGKQIYRYFTF